MRRRSANYSRQRHVHNNSMFTSIDEIPAEELRGKRVLVRAGFDVPLNDKGEVADLFRLPDQRIDGEVELPRHGGDRKMPWSQES